MRNAPSAPTQTLAVGIKRNGIKRGSGDERRRVDDLGSLALFREDRGVAPLSRLVVEQITPVLFQEVVAEFGVDNALLRVLYRSADVRGSVGR